MAGKIKSMSQIKQLLLLHKEGKKIKFIARTLGMSKNTVKSYLNKVKELKTDIDAIIKLDEPLIERLFYSGNPA